MDLTQPPDSEAIELTQKIDIEEESQEDVLLDNGNIQEKFLQNPSSVTYDGIIFSLRGKNYPLAFFKDSITPYKILVGRGDDCDVKIPSDIVGGASGISRKAFFLQRDVNGSMSITSMNSQQFQIKGPCKKLLTVVAHQNDNESREIIISVEDEIHFHQCYIYFHDSTRSGKNLIIHEQEEISKISQPVSTLHELKQASSTLSLIYNEVESTNNGQILHTLLPGVITRLQGLLPGCTAGKNSIRPKKRKRGENERSNESCPKQHRDIQEKEKFLREKKKVRNAVECLLKPLKNGGRKQKKIISQAQATIKRAKTMSCYFFKQGYCADGSNCYFNHPDQSNMSGKVISWYKEKLYGFIKSTQSAETWYFQRCDLHNNFQQNVEIGMKVNVRELLGESGPRKRATGISLCE